MAYINRIALLFVLLLVLASCRRSHVAAIKQSMSLADSFPDRALNILDSVRQQKVSDAEQPLYALAYTMALGKKSIEVDDDSLLRIVHITIIANCPTTACMVAVCIIWETTSTEATATPKPFIV